MGQEKLVVPELNKKIYHDKFHNIIIQGRKYTVRKQIYHEAFFPPYLSNISISPFQFFSNS